MRKVVVVRPQNPDNTGFIARLAHNFCFDLEVVDPEFNLSRARSTANNAQKKIEEARIGSLEELLAGGEYTVGSKPGHTPLRSISPRNELKLVVGPESSGLTSEEIRMCDEVASIETPGYSSLSQSHAAAVLMHHFSGGAERSKEVKREALDHVQRLAGEKTRRLVERSSPDAEEVQKLIEELRGSAV